MICRRHWSMVRRAVGTRDPSYRAAEPDPLEACRRTLAGRAAAQIDLHRSPKDECPICKAAKAATTCQCTYCATLTPAERRERRLELVRSMIDDLADAALLYARSQRPIP
jgi:hypothetical protein